MKRYGFAKKIGLNSTFTKMLISFIFIIVFTVMAFSAALYYQFSKATVSDITGNYQEKLEQNMYQMEYIRNQVYALGNQILNNSEMIRAMYWSDVDIFEKNKVTQELDNIKNSYSVLHSIFLYNGTKKELYSNVGSSDNTPLTTEMYNLLDKYNMEDDYNFKPIILKYNKNGTPFEEDVISIIFTDYKASAKNENKSGLDVLEGVVIINLNAEYLRNFFNAPGSGKGFNTIIINGNGNVICGSGPIAFGSNAGKINYIAPLLTSDKKSGYMIEGGKEKTLFIYSKDANLPFLFVSIPGYNQVLEKIYSLRNTILIILLVIFVLGLVISILAAYNIYLPFNKLLGKINRQLQPESGNARTRISSNEINYLSDIFTSIISRTNELETAFKEYKPFVRKMFLKGILEGDAAFNDIDKPELNLNVKENACVILTSIDNYTKSNSFGDRLEKIDLLSDIEKVIISVFSSDFGIETATFEDGCVAAILTQKNPDTFQEWIISSLKEVGKMISVEYEASITSVIGLTVEKIEDIHLSYGNCRDLLKYRFILGYGSVIDNNSVDGYRNNKYVSFRKHTDKLIQAIKLSDIDDMNKVINIIFKQMSDLQYDYVRLTINQLALDVIKSAEPLLNSDNDYLNYNNIYSNLNNIDRLDEVRQWFMLYCKGIIDKVEQGKDNRIKDMIDTALKYMQENYAKSDISAELLAEMANITPGYFGKLFASYVNKSVNEYLIELRMNKAKELLECGEATVSEITGRVGFMHQSYFTTIFRKHFGMTPYQYRANYKKTSGY